MSHPSNQDPIIPQDLGLDDADVNDLGIPEALTQDEIEELINSPQFPAAERLGRLIELREHLAMRAASEFGDNDAASLLSEVERGIAYLQTQLDARADEPEDYDALDPAIDIDPIEHRETLSPDDDALLDIEEDEEDEDDVVFSNGNDDEDEDDDDLDLDDDDDDDDDLDEDNEDADDDLKAVLDPEEWEADGDGFDSEKGVR